ncbi:class I SAM-dependent methyltransferase [Methylobacterium nodulans]|uniref:Methyltransferase type 11 n=1 Tax=Methylobacterium nodulans (strain LMG 21967 / CNCM I-2342 / ORS 2060) TaxID=460265 RepID=B8IGP4_METNO|nr:class I SAM-dependent methyltransferase [Methylobacterium nodulans]ACL55944.1 Methyltransferase type 11 [Methylobacterium nodulans ORS 2060]
MADPVAHTIAYYDRHAAAFAGQTAELDLSPLYDRFLRRIRPGGRILDAGCGPGRDTIAFAQRGYEVIALDASEEMVALARKRVADRAAVYAMRFEGIFWRDEFDGIWACASLLHVPSSDFAEVASRLAEALRPGGTWYMSFKLGVGERRADGRLFVDHTEETLRCALRSAPVQIEEVWTSEDVRPGRAAERWLNAIAVRPSAVAASGENRENDRIQRAEGAG